MLGKTTEHFLFGDFSPYSSREAKLSHYSIIITLYAQDK